MRYLGTLENIFTFDGKPGHEIVLVYDGTLRETALYEQTVIRGMEASKDEIRAVWKNIDEFGEGRSILYPTGLQGMLKSPAVHSS